MHTRKKKGKYLLHLVGLFSLLMVFAGCYVLDPLVTHLEPKEVVGVWYLQNDRRATVTFSLPDKLQLHEMPLAALTGDRSALSEIIGSGKWSIRKNGYSDAVVVDISLTGETARKYNSSSDHEMSVGRNAMTGLYLYTSIGDPDSGDKYILER